MNYLLIIYILITILLAIYFKKKKYFLNYSGDIHQLFSNEKNIPLTGGFFLVLPIILINIQNYIYISIVITIFLLGLFSDRKILLSPKKRFLYQSILVLTSVVLLNLEISSSRLEFFDKLLEYSTFNIIFTSFCLLILINGSNFVDGLNGLLLTYMISVIFVLYNLDLLPSYIINEHVGTFLIILLITLVLLNLSNILMLGDAGVYILSFFTGYLIITSHISNSFISPYFFITLIWYPCFENLFSILRKLNNSQSPLIPDNYHLHQLVYTSIKKKYFKSKLGANNFSSFLILLLNFFIFYLSTIKPYDSTYQISLILVSILFYLFIYFILHNIQKLKKY